MKNGKHPIRDFWNNISADVWYWLLTLAFLSLAVLATLGAVYLFERVL